MRKTILGVILLSFMATLSAGSIFDDTAIDIYLEENSYINTEKVLELQEAISLAATPGKQDRLISFQRTGAYSRCYIYEDRQIANRVFKAISNLNLSSVKVKIGSLGTCVNRAY